MNITNPNQFPSMSSGVNEIRPPHNRRKLLAKLVCDCSQVVLIEIRDGDVAAIIRLEGVTAVNVSYPKLTKRTGKP